MYDGRFDENKIALLCSRKNILFVPLNTHSAFIEYALYL